MASEPTPQDLAATPAQQLSDYLRALRRRWRLIALVAGIVTAAALVVSFTATKQYDATAKLLLGQSDQEVNALISGNSQSSNDPERDINTGVELIKLDTIADQVRKKLQLKVSSAQLLDQVTTKIEGTSNVVSLTARDSDPKRAAAIANGFATGYAAFRQTSARAGLNQAAGLARSELNSLSSADRSGDQGRQLQARIQELQTAAALQTGGVEIVRSASAPSHPSRPRPLLSGVLGVFLGLLLGAAAALVLELVDRRLKDEEAVEEVFAAPILASIPRPPRRRPGMPGDDPNQREAYGMLAANLRFSTLSAEAGTLIVTSPSPAEGKTTVTLGLARSLALLGQRVIAIEADLRRPAFSRYANLDGQQGGLNAVLSGGSKLGEELVWLDAADFRPVTLDGLKEGLSFALLPVGGATPMNPQRALSLPAMGELIEEARALADVVVIDTAPIGTVNDAATLVSRVDATVVVSRLNRTTRDAARRTRRLLANLGIPLAGVVITDTALSTDGYYYDGRAPKEAAEARADARASS